MRKIDQGLPDSRALNEGWSIHVYGSNRRLLCTLDASHGWSLVAGLAIGFVMTVGYVSLNHQSITEKMPATQQSAIKPAQVP